MERYQKVDVEIEEEPNLRILEGLQTRSLPVFLFHLAFASGTSLRDRAADFITMSFTETFAPKSCVMNKCELEE
jgi:hypothetical protein